MFILYTICALLTWKHTEYRDDRCDIWCINLGRLLDKREPRRSIYASRHRSCVYDGAVKAWGVTILARQRIWHNKAYGTNNMILHRRESQFDANGYRWHCIFIITIYSKRNRPLLLTWFTLTLILAWLRNYTNNKVLNKITYPFPNFNGATVDVWEWICTFIKYSTGHVITYPWWD